MKHKASLDSNVSVEPNSVQGMRRTATAIAVASVLSVATMPQAVVAGSSYTSNDQNIAVTSPTFFGDGPDLHHAEAYFDANFSGSYGVYMLGEDRAHNNTISNDNGYSVYTSGSTAAIQAGYEAATDDARADNNTISNSGHFESSGSGSVITGSGVGSAGVLIPGFYPAYAGTTRITAFAYGGNGDADAEVDHNLIENTVAGEIVGNGTNGVLLGSFAYASGFNNDSDADTSYNTVSNAGGISSDISAVEILSLASGFSGSEAKAAVTSNVVTNADGAYIDGGLISGVDMTAIAIATPGGPYNADNAEAKVRGNSISNDGYMGGFFSGASFNAFAIGEDAVTEVVANTITNTGDLGGFMSGTTMNSVSIGEDTAESGVSQNSIDNSGEIGSALSGVMMNSFSMAEFDAEAEVNSNTINNAADSEIYGDGFGIMMNAVSWSAHDSDATVNGNEINNAENAYIAGTINGIGMRAIGQDYDSSGEVAVSGNSISNAGVIFSGEDEYTNGAVTLAAYGNMANVGLFGGEDYGLPFANDTEVNGNMITNSGTGAIISGSGETYSAAVTLLADSSTGNKYFGPAAGASAEVLGNRIDNDGLIGSYAFFNEGGGIELLAIAGAGSFESNSGSTSIGSMSQTERTGAYGGDARANGNTITNSGTDTINVDGVFLWDAEGILVNADTSVWMSNEASATGYSGAASVSAGSYSWAEGGDSDVESNSIENSGTISVHGYYAKYSQGIVLASDAGAFAETDANANAYGFVSGSATADSWASGGMASVNDNIVMNSGSIETHGEDFGLYLQGILLTSDASAYASASASAFSSGGSTYASAATYAEAGTALVHNNSIENSGDISTYGYASSGIELSAFATADASGSASGYSVNSNASGGFASVHDNTVSNSGDIFAPMEDSAGILLYADAGANASGGSGFAQAGIASVNDNDVSNSGIITADYGIVLAANATAYADRSYSGEAYLTNNTITNSGSIIAERVGIAVYGQAEGNYVATVFTSGQSINNTGDMTVYDGAGIVVGAPAEPSGSYTWDNTIQNTGTILAGEDAAILIQGEADNYGSGGWGSGSNSLILGAPGFIAGDLLLDEDSNVDVTLRSGAGHSVNWTFENSGGWGPDTVTLEDPDGVPWFSYSGGGVLQFATIDPTAFAAAHNQVADLAGMASGMQFGNMGQDESGMASGDPMTSMDDGGVWLAIEAGVSDYDGDGVATLDQDAQLQGIAAGYSAKLNAETRVGAMLGYGKSELEVDSNIGVGTVKSYESEADGVFGGIYGRAKLGSIYLDLAINAGWQSHDQARLVNDNLEYDGKDFANASYDSFWFSPEVGVMLPISVSDTLTVTPNLRARYVSQSIDGYTESDSDANATVDDMDIGVTELRGGVDVTHRTSVMALTGTIGYMSRSGNGDDSVNITMIGDNNDVPFHYSDVDAAYGGVSFAYKLNEATTLKLNASVTVGDEVEAGSASASLNMKF